MREAAAAFGSVPANINLALSGALIDFPPGVRPLKLHGALQDVLAGIQLVSAPAFLDNTEILFDASLQANPLLELKTLSRTRTVAAVWNGLFADGRLTYAESHHPEFREYGPADTRGVQIVTV